MLHTLGKNSWLNPLAGMSVRSIAIVLAAMFLATGLAVAQEKLDDNSTIKQSILGKRVNLGGHGSIEIPESFRAFCTANWVDAWFGYIRSSEGDFKIEYSFGIVESPFKRRSGEIELMDSESIPEFVSEAGRRWEERGSTIVAEVRRAYFSAQVSDREQEDLFYRILSTFERRRCGSCAPVFSAAADHLSKIK